MTRLRPILITVLAGAALAATAGPAAAAARPGHFDFYDCQGPAGTPTPFTALKENVPAHGGSASAAVAFRLEDGGTFIVHQFGDFPIGNGITSDKLPVSC